MNVITATEIKRYGISAVNDKVKLGPVHVIKKNNPSYVIMQEKQYNNILRDLDEAYIDRIHLSLLEVKKGKTLKFKNVKELMKEIEHQTSE
jgi:PHD/YefM family antitoxin component YafN of YafNO toxin-antitoxin module